MNNPCWYNLKIDIKDCFLKDFRFPNVTGKNGVWHPLASKVFNSEWLRYMVSIGLPIYSTMIFYRAPYAHTIQAHIDICKNKDTSLSITNFGINWCYGGKGSEMVWYEMPTGITPIQYTASNDPFMAWNISTLKEIERTHIDETATIVRTGIPHSIKMDSDPRWVISARCALVDNLSWDDALEVLRKKNLIIER